MVEVKKFCVQQGDTVFQQLCFSLRKYHAVFEISFSVSAI